MECNIGIYDNVMWLLYQRAVAGIQDIQRPAVALTHTTSIKSAPDIISKVVFSHNLEIKPRLIIQYKLTGCAALCCLFSSQAISNALIFMLYLFLYELLQNILYSIRI